MTAFIKSALDYAAIRGWRVFPCDPETKRPFTAHGLHDATLDPEQIRAWWKLLPTAMIAVATGKASGIVGIDVDVDRASGKDGFASLQAKGIELPPTMSSETPRGGRHLIFAYPEGEEIRNSASKLAPHVDVRGEGGYLILPPSVNGAGVPYRWLPGAQIVLPLPANLRVQPEQPRQQSKPDPQASDVRKRAYGAKVLGDECMRVASADEGARNATLFQSACRLFELAKGECIAESRARSELEAAAAAAGLDEREIYATLESAWKRVEAKGPGDRVEPRSEPALSSQTPPLSWRTHTTSAGVLERAEYPPMKEVLPGLIAEGATLLCGKPKKGKTWMALDIAIAIAAHRFCLGGLLPHAGDVLYIALEDNARRLQRRLRQIIPDGTPWPERLTFATAWRRLDQGGLDDMAEWIGEHPEKRLIVVDTLAAVRPMSREYGFIEDYTALSGLQRLANQYQVAILVVHHLRKAGADDFGDEISGTLGLTAAVDAFLVLRGGGEGDGGHDKAELCLRSRDIEEKKFGATFSAATCRWTLDSTTSQDRSRTRVLAVLAEADEPLSPAEIMRLAGLSRTTIDNQLMRLRKAGEVFRKDGKYSLGGKPGEMA